MFKNDLVKVLEAIDLRDPQNIVFPLIYDVDFEDRNISEMDLSARSENSLKRNKIMTMRSLMANMQDIHKLRNLGRKSELEIKNKFLETWYSTITEEQNKKFWEEFVKQNAVA